MFTFSSFIVSSKSESYPLFFHEDFTIYKYPQSTSKDSKLNDKDIKIKCASLTFVWERREEKNG